MIIQTKPLHDINNKAIHILCQELGLVNTIRFLNQFTTGYGNYTEERKDLFGELSLEEIIAEIKETHKNQKR